MKKVKVGGKVVNMTSRAAAQMIQRGQATEIKEEKQAAETKEEKAGTITTKDLGLKEDKVADKRQTKAKK